MDKINRTLDNPTLCKSFDALSRLGKGVVAVLVAVCFSYLSVWSILGTTTFDSYDKGYTFTYEYDNVVLNLVLMVLVLVLVGTMFSDAMRTISPKKFSIALSVYVLVVGTLWVLSAKSLPTSDCKNLVETAATFVDGDYQWFDIDQHNYYYRYPFQLGFVVWCQAFVTVFKSNYTVALQIANVVCLVAVYLGLTRIVDTTLHDRAVTNYTVLLFFFCVQALMFTTLIYGILSGLAFGVWAIYFAIRYIQTDRKLYVLPAAVLLGVSVTLKPNNMIIMVAVCIALALKFLDTRKLFDIVAVLACFVVGNYTINLAVAGYENATGCDLGDGIPQITYADIGLHESNPYYRNTYGWYNKKYATTLFVDNGYDREATSKVAKEQVLEQIEYFKQNPEYANRFFTEKLLSQWNEPTYASMWVSERGEHSGEVPEFVDSIYYGSKHDVVVLFDNLYQQIVFVFACVFLLSLLKRRDVSLYILPLVVLGGFMYHLVFEAKSQYVFSYFLLLIPMAAYGVNALFSRDTAARVKALLKRAGTEPVREASAE